VKSLMTDLKDLVRREIGFRVISEARLRLTRAGPTLALRRRETFEVNRALAILKGRPKALVATIIPTYRRHDLLPRAVESALQQSVVDQVVIVIDDGGGLPKLPDDPRLTVVSLSRNCGVAGVVRNVGIHISDSKFLAFLDDDNEWTANHLEVSLAAHGGGADLTYTALQRVLPDGSPFGDALSWPFDRERLLNEQSVDVSTVVVKRRPAAVFSRVPRRLGDVPKEDWELVFRLSRKMRTEHIPVVTVRYLVSRDSYYTVWNGDINGR
jgi:glycosyltransferase involved in cell wall biosynthesis